MIMEDQTYRISNDITVICEGQDDEAKVFVTIIQQAPGDPAEEGHCVILVGSEIVELARRLVRIAKENGVV